MNHATSPSNLHDASSSRGLQNRASLPRDLDSITKTEASLRTSSPRRRETHRPERKPRRQFRLAKTRTGMCDRSGETARATLLKSARPDFQAKQHKYGVSERASSWRRVDSALWPGTRTRRRAFVLPTLSKKMRINKITESERRASHRFSSCQLVNRSCELTSGKLVCR